MAYRNPRFSWRHILHEIGDAGFLDATTGINTVPFDPDNPRARLHDEARGPQAVAPEVGYHAVRYNRQLTYTEQIADRAARLAVAGTGRANRVIVPPGHNMGVDRLFRIKTSNTPDTYRSPREVDGSLTQQRVISSGLLDFEFQDGWAYDPEILVDWYNSFSTNDGELGEIFWTNTVQPSTGVAYGWLHGSDPTVRRAEMDSGEVYTNVRGEPRRTFTLRHEAINGTDLRIYEELLRATYERGRGFWYDHPDSGDVVSMINRMDTPIDFQAFNCSVSVASSLGPDGEDCIECVSQSAGSTRITLDLGSDTDLRNSIVQFDFLPLATVAWLDSETAFKLEIEDVFGAAGLDLDYRIARALLAQAFADNWYRIQLDVEQDRVPSEKMLAPENSRVFTWRWDAQAGGEVVRFSKFRRIDKTKQPVYVEITPGTWRKPQESKAPGGAGGPKYNVEFGMREITA